MVDGVGMDTCMGTATEYEAHCQRFDNERGCDDGGEGFRFGFTGLDQNEDEAEVQDENMWWSPQTEVLAGGGWRVDGTEVDGHASNTLSS
jgi:hypothetical protein